MNIKTITQLAIWMLSLLLVKAHEDNAQYCDNLYIDFTDRCMPAMVTIKSCCELRMFSSDFAPSRVYKMNKGTFYGSANAYCNMTTEGRDRIVI